MSGQTYPDALADAACRSIRSAADLISYAHASPPEAVGPAQGCPDEARRLLRSFLCDFQAVARASESNDLQNLTDWNVAGVSNTVPSGYTSWFAWFAAYIPAVERWVRNPAGSELPDDRWPEIQSALRQFPLFNGQYVAAELFKELAVAIHNQHLILASLSRITPPPQVPAAEASPATSAPPPTAPMSTVSPPPPEIPRPHEPTAEYCLALAGRIRWEGDVPARKKLRDLCGLLLKSGECTFDQIRKLGKVKSATDDSVSNDISHLNGVLTRINFPRTITTSTDRESKRKHARWAES